MVWVMPSGAPATFVLILTSVVVREECRITKSALQKLYRITFIMEQIHRVSWNSVSETSLETRFLLIYRDRQYGSKATNTEDNRNDNIVITSSRRLKE